MGEVIVDRIDPSVAFSLLGSGAEPICGPIVPGKTVSEPSGSLTADTTI
jgi:hypothetical protein